MLEKTKTKPTTAKKPEKPAAPVTPITKVVITPPNFARATVRIVGTAPLVQNRMSAHSITKMIETQKEGTLQKRGKRKRPPKDFEAAYKGAMHIAAGANWYGIPCSAIRAAMISACRTVDFAMTRAKLFLFVEPDGFDSVDRQPLIRLEGEPREFMMAVRLASGTTDIASRPMFEEWSANVRLKWDADALSTTDIVNLLARAGVHVGIGAGRPDSRESAGMGFGTFEIQN